MTAENRPWLLNVSAVHPDGTQVTVQVAVPVGTPWTEVADATEVAQMTACRAMSQIVKIKEKAPF